MATARVVRHYNRHPYDDGNPGYELWQVMNRRRRPGDRIDSGERRARQLRDAVPRIEAAVGAERPIEAAGELFATACSIRREDTGEVYADFGNGNVARVAGTADGPALYVEERFAEHAIVDAETASRLLAALVKVRNDSRWSAFNQNGTSRDEWLAMAARLGGLGRRLRDWMETAKTRGDGSSDAARARLFTLVRQVAGATLTARLGMHDDEVRVEVLNLWLTARVGGVNTPVQWFDGAVCSAKPKLQAHLRIEPYTNDRKANPVIRIDRNAQLLMEIEQALLPKRAQSEEGWRGLLTELAYHEVWRGMPGFNQRVDGTEQGHWHEIATTPAGTDEKTTNG